jgi:hypothetical protein
MKAILEFNLPEEQEEYHITQQAFKMHTAFWNIGNDLFRPARKHGYPDARIQSLVEKLDLTIEHLKAHDELSDDWPRDEYGPLNATDLIHLLEQKYHAILRENGVDL